MQIGGKRKEWCGIFAVAVWAHCGVGVKWTLNYKEHNKNILSAPGLPFEKRHGRTGIRRGDIAFVNDHSHHFIITEVNGDLASTVEGNQAKNTIRAYHLKHLTSVTTYYTVRD